MPARHAIRLQRTEPEPSTSLASTLTELGLRRGSLAGLPGLDGDATAGAETELQAVVIGSWESVDLPQTILASPYFANLSRRARRGDLPASASSELEDFLAGSERNVWEHSWVRLPRRCLSPLTLEALEGDLLADKARPELGRRQDAASFSLRAGGEELLRLPVSYLLKLALVEAVAGRQVPAWLRSVALRLAAHFSNDNTSPETTSFSVVQLLPGEGGRALAEEGARRFLLTQLLAAYANQRLGAGELGQQVVVFHSPSPPQALHRLNRLVSDAFYRELFMSPCLAGWDRGEEKREYMALCHQVLSRSQLAAVAKMREAGIIRNNLVTLPSTSNLALANNGTHLSLGSRRLTALAEAGAFQPAQEKLLGDLVIKVVEHFLPLFVGLYSAAPSRFGFADFHPEKLLGFLPHELDFTHLRMLWRRWRGKARLSVLGHSLTPFGPLWLDRLLARCLGLAGDWVPDARLLDYPVALLATERCSALDGRPGGVEALKRDLEAMGVTDARLALYLPLRLRLHAQAGYCGLEARHFSLFERFEEDFGGAVALKHLVTCFAWQEIANGRFRHADLPDGPEDESERRQPLFAAAIGLPTFYVRAASPNRFLAELALRSEGTRASRRYPGYLRVDLGAFRRALLATLRRQGAPVVEALGAGDLLCDLGERLAEPRRASAAGRLTSMVLGSERRSPLGEEAEAFNREAERCYRETLRHRQIAEAGRLFARELARRDHGSSPWSSGAAGLAAPAERLAARFERDFRPFLAGEAGELELERLIHLILLTEARQDESLEPWEEFACATNTSSARPAAW
ncbi:MAG: hypothetical protein U0002_01425 [Thermoanaerobaculia bacterium]